MVYFGGTRVEFAGGYSPEMTEPTNSSRIDVISMASSAEIVVTVGTEADAPTAPSVPVDNIPICEVYHKAGEVKITDEDEEEGEGYVSNDLRKFLRLSQSPSYTDVTGTRALDTIYQNTSGKTMMVLITVRATVGIEDVVSRVTGRVGVDTPPTDDFGVVENTGQHDVGSTAIEGVITLIVPNNYYYTAVSTGTTGGVSKELWIEITPNI